MRVTDLQEEDEMELHFILCEKFFFVFFNGFF
jgi:hypothetical protein